MTALVARARSWHTRWATIEPILVAEFVVVLGFGALLPILPLFVTEHGIDVVTLGLITAAWAIAKIIAEPIFGHVADHFPRKPMMIIGLLLLGVFTMLPLVFTSALGLFVLRLLSGVSAGMYDPPARGIIVDSTEEGERGEAFGLYSAAQMGGLLVGPVVGSIGASLGGGYAFPFVLTGGLAFLAAVYLAVVLPSSASTKAAHEDAVAAGAIPGERAPLGALLNRLLLAAVVMNLGFSLAAGTYEVIWSLFLQSLGASIDFIGLSFAMFALPVLLFSAYAGRVVDRRGGLPYAAAGGMVIACCGLAYSISVEPIFPGLVGLIEGTAFAFVGPALYSLVAKATPEGRSATAQGIYGASSQIGVVVGALLAGWLWEHDHRYPFWFFFLVATTCVVVGVALARGAGPMKRAVTVVATGLLAIVLVGCGEATVPSGTASIAPTDPTASSSTQPSVEPTATTPPAPTATPARTPFEYVVKPGDTLSSIASRFQLDIGQLLAANGQIEDPDHIEAGVVLTIPPPDAPSGLPEADALDDPAGDLNDEQGQPAFAPGYVDISRLEARVDGTTLYVELLTVSRPIPTDPTVEQISYDVYVDTTGDGEADFQFRANNTLDPNLDWAAVVVELANSATSPIGAFPGTWTVGPTVRFEVSRNVLGDTRSYAVAASVQRRYFIGGVGDPEAETSFDYLPDTQWPRANSQWLTVGR